MSVSIACAKTLYLADLHMAQLMPLPLTVSCFSIILIGLTFVVLAYQGNPGKEPLNGCVCDVNTAQIFENYY